MKIANFENGICFRYEVKNNDINKTIIFYYSARIAVGDI